MESSQEINAKRTPRQIEGETDIIARSREGDTQAYRVLVEAYQDHIFSLAISMIRQREPAEDLTQEVFVKAYFALPRFKGDSTFFTWLFRICTNSCLDYLRKKRLPEISLESNGADEESSHSPIDYISAPETERPEATLEERAELDQLFAGLNPDQRFILTLREAQGYTYEEIADMLNCTVNTVKSRLFRAREALQRAFRARPSNNSTRNNVKKDEETIP